jgi:hypothetical protein
VNENDKVMTENFAERFIDHRDVGLAPQAISEFALHHGERRFDVRTLVVMREKVRALELEIVIHLLPCSTAVPAMMRCEGNKRRGASFRRHRFSFQRAFRTPHNATPVDAKARL